MPFSTGNRSVPDIARDLVAHLATLIRTEGQLARTEVAEKIGSVGNGLTLVAIGAVLLIPALVVLFAAGVEALAQAGVPTLWAALAVGCGALLLGVIFLLVGLGRFKAARLVPNRTIEQLQRDAAIPKHQMRSDHGLHRAA